MKRGFVAVTALLFILCAASVFAQTAGVEVTPDSLVVKDNETAEFTIKISHDVETGVLFDVYTPDVLWDVRLSDTPRVNPEEIKELTLFLRPLYVNPGIYGVPVYFRSLIHDITIKQNIFVEVQSSEAPSVDYRPAIRGSISMPSKIDPREGAIMTVHMDNKNPRAGPVSIKVRSTVINKDYTTTIDKLEKKDIDFEIEFDPQTAPQKDTVRVTFIAEDDEGKAYQFDLEPKEYTIEQYTQLDRGVQTDEFFLKTIETITLRNTGNEDIIDTYRVTKSFFKDMFTLYDPKPEKIEKELVWTVALGIDEEMVVTQTTSYRPPFYILIAIILGIIIYYVVRSPVIVVKTSKVLATREGGISELKVRVHVLNRSKRPMHKVRVVDYIPRIAALVKESEVGSVEPTKVLKGGEKGTIMRWNLDKLEAGEERIIRYRIRSKLSILGELSLPPAVVKFEAIKGNERSTKGNVANISLSSK